MTILQEAIFKLCVQARMDLIGNRDATATARLTNLLYALKLAYPKEYAIANPTASEI